MLKKTIEYTDFNEEKVNEDFFFHLSKAELVELEMSHAGGLQESIQRIIKAEDGKAIIAEFKNIILSSYGERSTDGKRFVKNQDLRDEFESTEAYSILFMELVTDADKALEFIHGVIPQDLAEEVTKVTASTPALVEVPAVQGTEVKNDRETITKADLMLLSKEDFISMQERVRAGETEIVE